MFYLKLDYIHVGHPCMWEVIKGDNSSKQHDKHQNTPCRRSQHLCLEWDIHKRIKKKDITPHIHMLLMWAWLTFELLTETSKKKRKPYFSHTMCNEGRHACIWKNHLQKCKVNQIKN